MAAHALARVGGKQGTLTRDGRDAPHATQQVAVGLAGQVGSMPLCMVRSTELPKK